MFYYVLNNSIIYKSEKELPKPAFMFDLVMQGSFKYSDVVIIESGKICKYYGSELYKRHNGLDYIESENDFLKKKLADEEKLVAGIVLQHDTLKAERDLLLANRKSNV